MAACLTVPTGARENPAGFPASGYAQAWRRGRRGGSSLCSPREPGSRREELLDVLPFLQIEMKFTEHKMNRF